jgi:2-polyprenyl-6-hydroxyphenyl methylase/3-demethylubiquinone-9 3-methyltransferase
MSEALPAGYRYTDAKADHTEAYLWPAITRELLNQQKSPPCRLFDLGCGNGSLATELTARGYQVTGVDPSTDGIRIAQANHPELNLHLGSAFDDLAARFGRFPALVSLEVVEHVFYPRKYAKCVFDLLEPGGIALISTPYHSYMKNLALAVSGKMDGHFTALWDYGHIKFWSRKTLKALLNEAGLEVLGFHRVGRIRFLAKSMIAVARRPA